MLVLHDVKTKKPSYKCVVEEICTRCGHCASKVDYPSADDPTTAMAMVKGQGADPANATPFEQQPNQTVDASAPATEVASRNFVERLFVRQ